MLKFHNHYYYRSVCGLLLAVAFFVSGSAGAQGAPVGTVHSVTLTWQAPAPAGGSGTISGYNVYRSPSNTANYAKLNTALAAGLTFTDSSVSAGASYTYCVSTVDSLGEESVCSVPATANVPSNPNAPSAPLITVK
jgi:fibronectin type 3 domain-containing protein